jgi:hypothetical protein
LICTIIIASSNVFSVPTPKGCASINLVFHEVCHASKLIYYTFIIIGIPEKIVEYPRRCSTLELELTLYWNALESASPIHIVASNLQRVLAHNRLVWSIE